MRKKAAELEQKLKKNQMSLDDFLTQLRELKKMGSLSSMLGMLPGVNKKQLEDAKIEESQLVRTEAIILSMTKKGTG
jgi:signal recognition particle subunit SRP54